MWDYNILSKIKQNPPSALARQIIGVQPMNNNPIKSLFESKPEIKISYVTLRDFVNRDLGSDLIHNVAQRCNNNENLLLSDVERVRFFEECCDVFCRKLDSHFVYTKVLRKRIQFCPTVSSALFLDFCLYSVNTTFSYRGFKNLNRVHFITYINNSLIENMSSKQPFNVSGSYNMVYNHE